MQTADRTMTRDVAHNRVTGALFFVGFGAMWLVTGCTQTHHFSASMVAALTFTSACLLAGIAYLLRRLRELPDRVVPAEELVRAQRMFTAINIILWVSVATAVAILSLLHMPEYIVPAISMLVGLHLFPLAGSLGNRQYYSTGALLLALPLLGLALLPPERVSGVCAVAVGTVLLLSAAVALGRVAAVVLGKEPDAMDAKVTQRPL